MLVSLRGPLGDTPSLRNRTFLDSDEAPKGTTTKVTSANRSPPCAYPATDIIEESSGAVAVLGVQSPDAEAFFKGLGKFRVLGFRVLGFWGFRVYGVPFIVCNHS